MERLSQSEIEFVTRCLKATRKLHTSLDCGIKKASWNEVAYLNVH